MKPYQIGIDLGGTKTEAILFDPDGCEMFRERRPTPKQGSDVYTAICDTVHQLIEDTAGKIPGGKFYTVGIGIPGIIDTKTLLVQNANTTSLIGKPFKRELEKRLGRPIGVENDANCFTLAEAREGAAKGYRMVFGIIMGTGCGGGICVDNRVHDGLNGIAGEWGHFPVDPKGLECFCGNKGCIETKISGTGVEKSHARRFNKSLKMDAIVDGYRKGDPECSYTFLTFLEDFGRSLGGLISLLDPDAIVLGGGLSNIDELYTLGMEKVRQYAFHPRATTPVLENKLGDSAGVFGAAWIGV
jgi:fructokinase